MIKIGNTIANENLNKEIETKTEELKEKKRYLEIDGTASPDELDDVEEKINQFESLKATLNNNELTASTLLIAIPKENGETEYVAVEKENFAEFEKRLSETGPDFEYSSTILKAKDIIPGTKIKKPRDKKDSESIEEYEKMLADYYKANGNFVATINKDGVREPYPHEQFEWVENKYANRNTAKNYYSKYYTQNVAKMQQEENSEVITSEKPQKKKFQAKKRKVIGKRKWWDFIHSVPASIKNINQIPNNEVTWSNIKKGLIRVGIGALILAASAGVIALGASAIASFGLKITITNIIFPIIGGAVTGVALSKLIKLYKKDKKSWQDERDAQKPKSPEEEQEKTENQENLSHTQTKENEKSSTKEETPITKNETTPASVKKENVENINVDNKKSTNTTSQEAKQQISQEEYLMQELQIVKNQTDAYKMQDENMKKTIEYKNLLQQKKNILMMMLKLANQEIDQDQTMETGGMSLWPKET